METHCILTNRGPAFTKGTEDPTEVKSAMIDRSIALFVRTLGVKTHSDAEFKAHLQLEEVKRRLSAFRIFTCLVALVKMFIFRNPIFQPDMALAQKMWDEWDNGEHGLDQGYGLPKPSPRKNMKRTENCVTMTVVNAVATVFFYKNSSYQFECGKMDEDGLPKPFKMTMLWEAIQLLQPTQEIIHMAWSFGLNYNIGTSEMGLNTMTIVAEQFGMKIGDILSASIDDPASKFVDDMHDHQVIAQAELQKATDEADAQREGGNGGGGVPNKSLSANRVSGGTSGENLAKLLQKNRTVCDDVVKQRQSQLRRKRESLNRYRYRLVATSRCSGQLKCVETMVNLVLGGRRVGETYKDMDLDLPPNWSDIDKAKTRMSSANFGKYLFRVQDDLGVDASEIQNRYLAEEGDSVAREAYIDAYSSKHPGPENCIFEHEDDEESRLACPFCKHSSSASEDQAIPEPGELATHSSDFDQTAAGETPPIDIDSGAPIDIDSPVWLSLQCSRLLPDIFDAALFYKPQNIIQWSAGGSGIVDNNISTDEHAVMGSSKLPDVSRRKKPSGPGGGDVYDSAWLQITGEQYKTWFKFARYIKDRRNSTIANALDIHTDGLRDTLYLVSTRDNQRRCPEQPWLPKEKAQRNAFVDSLGQQAINSKTVSTKPNGNVASAPLRYIEEGPGDIMKADAMDAPVVNLFLAGKLPALDFYASNKMSMSPPIRMMENGVEANVGALHSHVTLCAEAVLICAQIPGIKNMHERFSHNTPGPDGLSSEETRDSDQDATNRGQKRSCDDSVRMKRSQQLENLTPEIDRAWRELCETSKTMPSDVRTIKPWSKAADLVDRRPGHPCNAFLLEAEKMANAVRKTDLALPKFVRPLKGILGRLWYEKFPNEKTYGPSEENDGWKKVCVTICNGKDDPLRTEFIEVLKIAEQENHTLPFSYDLISIAISYNMAKMLYDDFSTTKLAGFNRLGVLPKPLSVDRLPHLSMRFVGYEEESRQTISMPLPSKRQFPYVESGDPSEETSGITPAFVNRFLCRKSTASDRVEFISARQGATSMNGVTGDLFATSTWFRHAMTSLRARGIAIPNTPPEHAFANFNSCANIRVAEAASVKGIGAFAPLKLQIAEPGSYASIQKNKLKLAVEQRRSAIVDATFPSTHLQSEAGITGIDPMVADLYSGLTPENSEDVDEEDDLMNLDL
jgi:hypothetical protein